MKRLPFILVLFLYGLFIPHAFSQSSLTSTNPPTATDLIRLDFQARSMKYDRASDQLVVLSSNNTVSFLRPATLTVESQQQLSYNAVDLAVSDDASLLFVASDTDSSIHIHRLSDFSEADAVPITNGVPSNLESLPGGTNAFVVAVYRGNSVYDSFAFVNGMEVWGDYTTNWMARTATNLILFSDGIFASSSYRTDLHLNPDGALSATRGESPLFRPSGASSSIVENSKAYIFAGLSSVQCNVFDLAHLNTKRCQHSL